MTEEGRKLDDKQRDENMDRYDEIMNPYGHYSEKGKKKYIASLNGKCLDGSTSKAKLKPL